MFPLFGLRHLRNQLIPDSSYILQTNIKTHIYILRKMTLSQLFLMMALLAAAQMMHISKETHNSEEKHLSFLNFLNASFPRKLVITHSKDSDMSLLPVKNLVELRYTRSDKNFTWTAEKKSNGFYSFRDHNGEYLSCPPYPKNGQPLLIKHPADIINQHFIVQYAPNTKEQGYTIRCRESPNPYVGAVLEDGAEVTLSTTFNSSRDVWYFKVD